MRAQIVRGAGVPFEPASHERPDAPGAFKRVLFRGADLLNGRLQMLNWARLPGKASFRKHFHEDMEEVFVIMRGRVAVEVDGSREILSEGDAIRIPPKAAHTMSNLCCDEALYLVIGITSGEGGNTVLVEEPKP